MKNRKAKKGFTIIELVIVIAVIGILAAVLIPTFSGVIDNAKKSAAQSNASTAYQQYVFDEISKDNSYDQSKDTFFVVSGDYYFKVTNGQFDVNGTKGAPVADETYSTIKYVSGNSLSDTNPTPAQNTEAGNN